ncbi:hypothetical protein FJZ53_05575 [Candidatus Woesearchaeota archaeon]|nr:hypothetical protein [Candidatus Woesearchaeota archaeon]
MVKPGVIYHKDTRGNEGLFTLEEMAKKNLLQTPYSHNLHYANSVFEGIRAVWDDKENKLYLITLDQHVNRFLNSIKGKFHGNFDPNSLYNGQDDTTDDVAFGVTRPDEKSFTFLNITYDEIKDAIVKTVQANIKAGNIDAKQGCYVRPIVYRDQVWNAKGEFDPSLGVFSLKHSVVLEIETFMWGAYLSGSPKVIVYPEGIDTTLRHIKAGGNYAFGGIVKDYAMARGYSEGIITDNTPERNVLEGGGENLFVYVGDSVLTPDKSQSILPGTKRNLVIQLTKNLGYNLVETKIPLDTFLSAKSAGFSGTAAGYEGIDRVKDAKTGRKQIFDLNHEPLVKVVNEYKKLITGKEVEEANKELQKKIRTEVVL